VADRRARACLVLEPTRGGHALHTCGRTGNLRRLTGAERAALRKGRFVKDPADHAGVIADRARRLLLKVEALRELYQLLALRNAA